MTIKKYLTTPEEILALKDTDTKIYTFSEEKYYKFIDGVLCLFSGNDSIELFNTNLAIGTYERPYILVEEPVKEADEKWKVIDEFPDYEVSSLGRVFSKKRNRMLKPYKSRGYEVVDLGVRSENRGARYVHRLVATAFIENPENKEEVNHKNSKRDDNRIENLEWVTPQENVVHSYRCGKQKYASRNRTQQVLSCSQPIVCVETGIRYFSISDASRKLHIHTANIARCVKNNKKSVHGLHFLALPKPEVAEITGYKVEA